MKNGQRVMYQASNRAEFWKLREACCRPQTPFEDEDGLIAGQDRSDALVISGIWQEGNVLLFMFEPGGHQRLHKCYEVSAERCEDGKWRRLTTHLGQTDLVRLMTE